MRPKLGARPSQIGLVTFAVTIGTVYFPAAGITVPVAGTAGWISVFLAFSLALPLVPLVVWLSDQAPTGDWGKAVQAWLGPWLGKLLLLFFSVIWFWLGALLLTQAGFVFHAIALPATPPIAINMALLVLVLLTDLKGVEVLFRTIEFLLMAAVPLIIGFLFGAIPASRVSNLLPLLGDGPMQIAKASYLALPWAMEGILFLLFASTLVKEKKRLTFHGLWSVGLAGITLGAIIAFTLAILGKGVTVGYIYPTARLIQSTKVSDFLEGLEIFVYPLWVLTSYTKATVSFVLASESIRGIVPVVKQPWRTLLLGAAFFAASLLPDNVEETVAGLGRVDSSLFAAFYAILPLMALWVFIRKRVKKSA